MNEIIVASKDDLRNAIRDLLAERNQPPQPKEELPDRIDSVEEASDIIRRSISFVYKHTMKKQSGLKDSVSIPLPFSRYGSRLCFSRRKLIEWRESQTIQVINPRDVMRDRLSKSAKRRDK